MAYVNFFIVVGLICSLPLASSTSLRSTTISAHKTGSSALDTLRPTGFDIIDTLAKENSLQPLEDHTDFYTAYDQVSGEQRTKYQAVYIAFKCLDITKTIVRRNKEFLATLKKQLPNCPLLRAVQQPLPFKPIKRTDAQPQPRPSRINGMTAEDFLSAVRDGNYERVQQWVLQNNMHKAQATSKKNALQLAADNVERQPANKQIIRIFKLIASTQAASTQDKNNLMQTLVEKFYADPLANHTIFELLYSADSTTASSRDYKKIYKAIQAIKALDQENSTVNQEIIDTQIALSRAASLGPTDAQGLEEAKSPL